MSLNNIIFQRSLEKACILVQSLWKMIFCHPGKLKIRNLCTSAFAVLEKLLHTFMQSNVYVCKDVHSSIGHNSKNLETQIRIQNRLEKCIAVCLHNALLSQS